MKNWIIMLMALIPIYQEIIFDNWRWADGKDDKPASTFIRVFLFIVLGLVTGFILDGNYWITSFTAGLFFAATHWLLFDPWLNRSRTPKKPWSYNVKGDLWFNKPLLFEYYAKLWLFYVTWLGLFHWDFIQGDFESVGTWWELVIQFITF